MARTLLLATLARRQGISFQLKTAGYQVIGTMVLNPSTARHEMEMSEADFLKHSKELARLCAVPGLGWYVVEFRDDAENVIRPEAIEFNSGLELSLSDRPLPDEASLAAQMGHDLGGAIVGRKRPATRQSESIDAAGNPKVITRQIVDDLKGQPFFALRKLAMELGINTDEIKGNDAMKSAIRAARPEARKSEMLNAPPFKAA